MAGIGHNSQTNVISLDDRRKWFQAELTRYAANERQREEALTCQQLGELNGLGRLQAQRQSLLDNIAHFYSINKRADPAPGVLLLITLYSDNNEGCCSLSVSRMADFLSREPRRVSQAISRLVEDKMVLVASYGSGRDTSRHYPWVHHSFGTMPDALTWILDVRAPARSWGRPKGQIEKTQDGPKGDISGKTQDDKCENPGRPPSSNTTSNTTDDKEREDSGQTSFAWNAEATYAEIVQKPLVVEPDVYHPAESDLRRFHELVLTWCSKKSDVQGLMHIDREMTDDSLRGMVRALGRVPPELAERAMAQMLLTMGGKGYEVTEQRGGNRLSGFLSYASKVMRTSYSDVAKGEMDLRTTAEIQAKRIEAFGAAVQRKVEQKAVAGKNFLDAMPKTTDEAVILQWFDRFVAETDIGRGMLEKYGRQHCWETFLDQRLRASS